MNEGKNYEREEMLEEYRALQGQLQKYYEQRQTILGLTVTAIGALMAFCTQKNSSAVEVALFMIVLMGGMLTRHCNFQILRRLAYIHVAIEATALGFRWCTTLVNFAALIHEDRVGTEKFSIPKRWLPEEYPLAYFLLGVIVTTYSLVLSDDRFATSFLVVMIGWGVLLPACVAIQRANGARLFKKLIIAWSNSLPKRG